MTLITVRATAKNVLARVLDNANFQEFVSEILKDCAIAFSLRGNAFEGFEFEIGESKIVDRSELFAELIAEAGKL